MIDNVRTKHPLIHCITNGVVQNFTANGLLAIGAAPVMSANPKEVGEMAQNAHGLLLNTGTLTDGQYEAMIIAGRAANENGTPIVLDPVAVGATSYRTKVVKELLSEVKPNLIRGNGGEIGALIGAHSEMLGVEGKSDQEPGSLAKEAANVLGTAICVTGEVDAVSNGKTTYLIKNGHEWLSNVVGTGCLLGAILLAYISSTREGALQASAAALAHYGLASEKAYSLAMKEGIGTFQQRFLDALSSLTDEKVKHDTHIQKV
ncbi:hydroxyethylthiazole kinase [Geomicrobium halophilum]|uniref:Hydroxyethylthiazole kinase n=1 Tax=Geomicrobium halophilum TaxID=549000 RepID=A0A841Q055_9BACL|nr:hydroxyethylthiazole kinase [Geomicrobium halophilum]MBB6450692.1 hydroxyethylthiazole kinase [Geomicrobium halophilum]